MTMKIEDADGNEIEVYTADELATAKTEAATAKEAELAPKMTELEEKLTGAQSALAARAGEFAQFRKLSDEAVAKLDEKDRTIYENGLALKEEQDKRVAAETAGQKALVDSVISKKAGNNAELKAKMEEMWSLIGVEANTPEQIEVKAQMVLGAISTQTPNLVAGVAGFTGSFAPPGGGNNDGKAYGETEEGKALASRLGLVTEPPKK